MYFLYYFIDPAKELKYIIYLNNIILKSFLNDRFNTHIITAADRSQNKQKSNSTINSVNYNCSSVQYTIYLNIIGELEN